MTDNSNTITVGKFAKPYGIKGWVSVYSFTEPPEHLFNYSPLFVERNGVSEKLSIEAYRAHTNHWVLKLTNCHDREQASLYTNVNIVINASQLPALEKGEYYWRDLEGLTVVNQKDETLGIVDHLFATGANDVLLIKGKKTHYIPYHPNYIKSIDIKHKKITVDWDLDF